MYNQQQQEAAAEAARQQAVQDAFNKQEQAQKEMLQAQYGGLYQNVQEGLASRGMGRSGFGESQIARLQGMEGTELEAIHQRMEGERLDYSQEQQQMEAMQNEAKRAKKRRKNAALGGMLGGLLGGAGGMLIGGPGGAYAGYQLGSGAGSYGYGGGQ